MFCTRYYFWPGLLVSVFEAFDANSMPQIIAFMCYLCTGLDMVQVQHFTLLAWLTLRDCMFRCPSMGAPLLRAFLWVQVFIDYNISGMSYVHLRNALFLQPLPELSSVLSSQQPARDNLDLDISAPTGIFTSATVPEYLVANPNEQRDLGQPAATMSAKKKAGDRAIDSTARVATARELEPVTLQGDTEEVELALQHSYNFVLAPA